MSFLPSPRRVLNRASRLFPRAGDSGRPDDHLRGIVAPAPRPSPGQPFTLRQELRALVIFQALPDDLREHGAVAHQIVRETLRCTEATE